MKNLKKLRTLGADSDFIENVITFLEYVDENKDLDFQELVKTVICKYEEDNELSEIENSIFNLLENRIMENIGTEYFYEKLAYIIACNTIDTNLGSELPEYSREKLFNTINTYTLRAFNKLPEVSWIEKPKVDTEALTINIATGFEL